MENSKIEWTDHTFKWTDHTFNPWIGCQHVSPGCDHCYAEPQNAFRNWNGGTWGPHAPRKAAAQKSHLKQKSQTVMLGRHSLMIGVTINTRIGCSLAERSHVAQRQQGCAGLGPNGLAASLTARWRPGTVLN